MKARMLILVVLATALAAGLLVKVARNSNPDRGDAAGAGAHDAGKVASIERADDISRGAGAGEPPSVGDTNRSTASRPANRHALGGGGKVALNDLPDGRLKNDLAQLEPAARARALAAIGELQIPAHDVGSLHVDAAGTLFYACTLGHGDHEARVEEAEVGPHDDAAPPMAADETFNGVVSITAVPIRHSRPGSTNKLYLDFTGHTVSGTAWNSRPGAAESYECRPFNRDFDELTLNWWEQEEIVVIWERVAEAFIGFDVDVTTEEPAVFDNRTARAVITSYRDANGVFNPAADASSGVAFLNVFGQPDYAGEYSVFFVYYPGGGTGDVADTIVHEFGHNLGLSHDGDAQREYYLGHAYGGRQWVPFMGGGYGTVAQWSKGEYFGANNPQDDLAIIGGKLASLPDDNPGGPFPKPPAIQNGAAFLARGAIERTADPDSFTFAAGSGPATFEMRPERLPTAYDVASRQSEIAVELRDSNGVLVASADPDASDVVSLSTTLAGGDYTLVVRGVGFGNPKVSPPTGFTAYGSIGRYSVTGTIVPPVAHKSPTIISQPESQTVFNGNGVTFEVVAQGNPATSYHWQSSADDGSTWSDLADGGAIAGSTTAALSVDQVTLELDNARYRCVVTNEAGTVTSEGATLRIRSAPVIVTQPSSQYLNTGDTANFSVAALGTPPLGYQWKKNGLDIPGATGDTLTLASVAVASAGSYCVVVSNRYGSTTSAIATLGIDTPPQVIASPQSKGVQVGQDLSLSVAAVGSPPLTYQWRKDGAPLPGATNATLLISGAGEGDSGQYSVSIGNAFGSATSGTATVVVGYAPTIVTQPVSAMVLSGSFYSFTVAENGTAPFAYQWLKSGAEIPGATGQTLNFVSANVSDDGVYSVRVSNAIGTVMSEPAVLTVNVLPRIVVQPAPQSAVVGGSATFTAAASGKPSPAFQWFKDGVAIDGATSASLVLTSIAETDAGSYHAVATNSVGAAESVHVALTVYPSLQISGNRVAAGDGHSLFIKEDGSLWGMGRNESGQLGDGTRETRINPVKIAEGVASVAVGPGHSLFIKTDGTLWAMGHNGFGQLGDGTNVHRDLPVQITQGVVAASGGGGHSLFIKSDGTLWAMGYGLYGQLGTGSTDNQWTPVQVATGVMSIAAGNLHTLFVKLDGTGWAVGYNLNRQSGGGSEVSVMVPIQVTTGLVEVAAGIGHSLFLKESGELLGFGGGGGVFGPQLTQIATGVAAVSAGGNSSTFIKEDGTLWTTGSNSHGQLGRENGLGDPGLTAEGIVGAAIGQFHMIFVGIDDTIWTTGGNGYGQLGDGLTVDRDHPLRIVPPSPPIILEQPMEQFGRDGSSVGFSVAAEGAVPITFQWLKDGVEIPGATGSTLEVNQVTPAEVGFYSVVLSNEAGSVISEPVSLTWIDEVPTSRSRLATGENFSLFLKSDGSLWGMGNAYGGRLGQLEDFQPLPVQIMTEVESVSSGYGHTMVLKTDGSLWTMGANNYHQLGYPVQPFSQIPTMIASNVAMIAAGKYSSLFVKKDGTLWWNRYESTNPDAPSQVWNGVKAVASGTDHQLILRVDGSLWVLGHNTSGRLGLPEAGYASLPQFLTTDVIAVAAGESHSLFLKSDGSLYGMGSNGNGQLGIGVFSSGVPVLLANGVAGISAGQAHSLFVKSDGTLWGMGSNTSGQLGLPFGTWANVPVQLASDVAEAKAGESHSLIRKLDDSIWATGANQSGQLGDGKSAPRFGFHRIVPVSPPVILVQPVKEFGRVGSTITLKVVVDGGEPLNFQWRRNGSPIPGANAASLVLTNVNASDFGSYSVDVSNEFGAVASDKFDFVSIPAIAPRVDAIALGHGHSLFVKGGGTLWGMGYNSSGQLSNGTTDARQVPTAVADGVLSVVAGTDHSLILKDDRSLWGAGRNSEGQLGDGTRVSPPTPVKISESVALMAAGDSHSLFVKEDGTLWAMGNNYSGQLGDGTPIIRLLPVQVSTGVVAVSANGSHGYFVRNDGTLWHVGNQSTFPILDARDLPKQVAEGVVDVSAGLGFAVFLKGDGSMWAIGDGVHSMFSSAAPGGAGAPFKVADGVAKIAAGDSHVLFLKTDGSLWATGGNTNGQVGDGTDSYRSTPVQVATGVASIAASVANSAFIKQDGTVWLMGNNYYGQLGIGTDVASWIPVEAGTINELRISAQPSPRAVVQGQSVTLAVSAAGFPTPSYQWLKDGVPIPGATSPTLTIANTGSADAGKYTVVVTNSTGSITSNVASLFVTPDPSTSRMINISTRAFAGSGAETLTVGFTIVGTGQKTLVIRGVGPKLADFNVPVVVEDPKLRLYKIDGTLIAENDDWESVVAANAGGFSLPPGSKDAALEVQLPPGGYTVQLINPGSVAEGMIEVYDISQDPGSRLVNLSCRMNLEPGQIVIVGTALTGVARPVVVRNSGPGLAQYLTDPEKPNAASDPVLHSFDKDGVLVGQNDDWGAELSPYFTVIGAFPLENGSKDASQRILITPGLNTVHATAKGEGGIVLIELYESP